MDSALAQVAWESSLVEPGHDRALEAYARRRLGIPHMTVRYFLAAPWVARAVVDLHGEFARRRKYQRAWSTLPKPMTTRCTGARRWSWCARSTGSAIP